MLIIMGNGYGNVWLIISMGVCMDFAGKLLLSELELE